MKLKKYRFFFHNQNHMKNVRAGDSQLALKMVIHFEADGIGNQSTSKNYSHILSESALSAQLAVT